MPDKSRRYIEPTPMAQADVLRSLDSESPEGIEAVLVAVALEERDYDFALATVLRGAGSDVASIRGTGILCLGHLARIHKRLPEQPVLRIVAAGLVDESEYVRGQSENAADDIELFVPELAQKIARARLAE